MSNVKVIGSPITGTLRPSRRARSSAGGAAEPRSKKKWALLALLLLFGGVAVWAIWFRGDSIQDQIAALRSQLDVEGITREQRRALFENADPAVRDAMFASRQQEWQAREQKFMNEFFAMSNADQIASLDKRIDEMERSRKAREKRDAERAKAGASANNQSGATAKMAMPVAGADRAAAAGEVAILSHGATIT